MKPFRPAAKRYLAIVVLAALGAAVLAFRHSGHFAPGGLLIALAGAMTAATLFQLYFTDKPMLFPDNAVLVAAILLLEPGWALLAVASGMVLAQVMRRRPWEQTLFNGAQAALAAGAGAGLLAVSGWRSGIPDLDWPLLLLAIGAMAAVVWVFNAAALGLNIAFQQAEFVPISWFRAARHRDRIDVLAHVAQVGLGVLAARVANAQGWMVLLLLLTGGAIFQALTHQVKLRRDAEARLVHQAFHDSLTGLPNRACFLDRLGQALARTGRTGESLAVIFLDLDRFKFVNDSLGHAAGDRVLAQVAERLLGCARPGDTVARLGGDEFTILLDGLAGGNEAEAVAARLAAAVGAPFALGGRELTITASIGIAVAGPAHIAPADLLRDADVAMYRAKEQGKARWAVFEPEMGTALRERAELEADMVLAAAQSELRLAYQPIVELTSGRVVGVEALVRWQHPTGGLLQPGVFIPLAEETGLIEPIGRWVLVKACRQARAWQMQFSEPPVVSVNISACQFQRPELVELVAFVLRATGLAPGLLKLEITESAVMANAETAVATLRQLKDLGVGVAIDDFGTGYSSLNYLRRFPVDELKIDRAFVTVLGRDPGDKAIVEAVVGLAHTLGLKVVAEGIETTDQLLQLRAMGCELGQGYHFGRPQSAKTIEGLLEKVTYAVGPLTRLTG